MNFFQKETAPIFDTGHGEYIYQLASPESSALQKHSIVYVEIAPGKSNRKHYHPQAEETYYILSGEGVIVLGNETTQLHAGLL